MYAYPVFFELKLMVGMTKFFFTNGKYVVSSGVAIMDFIVLILDILNAMRGQVFS